jgi:ABC-type transporter Mla subunit MlaD
MNRLLINLYAAVEAAPDDESHDQLAQIIGQAENLRSQINRMFSEDTPPLDATSAST